MNFSKKATDKTKNNNPKKISSVEEIKDELSNHIPMTPEQRKKLISRITNEILEQRAKEAKNRESSVLTVVKGFKGNHIKNPTPMTEDQIQEVMNNIKSVDLSKIDLEEI